MKAVHTPGLSAVLDIDDDDAYATAYATLQPGQFEIVSTPAGQRRFWFVCPGPCKTLAPRARRRGVEGSPPSWYFEGNCEAPTLHPSINHVGCWHGWLQGGGFRLC